MKVSSEFLKTIIRNFINEATKLDDNRVEINSQEKEKIKQELEIAKKDSVGPLQSRYEKLISEIENSSKIFVDTYRTYLRLKIKRLEMEIQRYSTTSISEEEKNLEIEIRRQGQHLNQIQNTLKNLESDKLEIEKSLSSNIEKIKNKKTEFEQEKKSRISGLRNEREQVRQELSQYPIKIGDEDIVSKLFRKFEEEQAFLKKQQQKKMPITIQNSFEDVDQFGKTPNLRDLEITK